MQKYKVVIIGSGIAGMSAAIYLKRGGIEPLIIEYSAPGGTLNLIPSVENFPGYESISGPDLAMNIYTQVNKLGIKYLFKNIKQIDLVNKVIDQEIEYDYLIVATGRRPRLLNLDNEDKLFGNGISTCALCDGNFYKDKDVLVVGGGNSAVSEALYLSNICKTVTMILRRDVFTAEKYLVDKILNTDNINIKYTSNITKYNILDDKIVSVTINDNEVINTEGVFLAIGSIPNSDLFDLEKNNGYIITNDKYETSVKDVFAIGDVIKKDFYQLINASSEGMSVASLIIKNEK